MADYFNHWLNFGRQLTHPPRIFGVNWFRLDDNGNFIWPGYGENMRVLQWIVERVNGQALGVESPLGWVPRYEDLTWSGIDFDREKFTELMAIDREQWKTELLMHEELFIKLYDRLPRDLVAIRELLVSSMTRSLPRWELE